MFEHMFSSRVTSARLPLQSSYVDQVIFFTRSVEFPVDELYAEIFRVMTPSGKLVVYRSFQIEISEVEMVSMLWFYEFDGIVVKTTY